MEEIHKSRDDGPPEEAKPPQLLPPRGPAPTQRSPVRRTADDVDSLEHRLDHSLAPGESGEAPPAQAFSRYDELDVLGSGGSGVVTLAVDRETGERVAIKRLRQTSVDRVRRFRREAETIGALDHPGIVKLLRVVE